MRRSIAATLIGIGLVAATAGCGSENVSTGSETRAEHPCDIPKPVLTDSGLNAEPLMTEPFGAEFAGWQGCFWKSTAGWYDLAVYYGPVPLNEFGKDQRHQDYKAVGSTTVGSREAVEFADALDPERQERCYIGISLPQGMALIWSRIPVGPAGESPQGDLCGEAERISGELASYLPG